MRQNNRFLKDVTKKKIFEGLKATWAVLAFVLLVLAGGIAVHATMKGKVVSHTKMMVNAGTSPVVKNQVVTIDPSKGIPQGLQKSDFYKTYTRTIHFKDADNPNGADVATAITQSINLVRWATYDETAHKVDNWGVYALEENGNPVGGTSAFDEVAVPDLSSKKLINPSMQKVEKQAVVTKDVQFNDPGETVNVTYQHQTRPVTPADNADTKRTVTRTINFVDGDKNNSPLGSVTQSVQFERDATDFDAYTNQIVYGSWKTTSDAKDWPAFTAPDKTADGFKKDPENAQVPEQSVTADSKNETITVVYHHDKPDKPVVPVNPVNPPKPKPVNPPKPQPFNPAKPVNPGTPAQPSNNQNNTPSVAPSKNQSTRKNDYMTMQKPLTLPNTGRKRFVKTGLLSTFIVLVLVGITYFFTEKHH
ncbi:hypothetical protein G6R29_03025 [Fructobacillus sp. M2-14]|uniref:Mub B2-like domain-containing protein n=1 Tax=Fructobacillus broussonetiae TaxID=2713173 RepID=A0ABS5QZR7_9LACO|nr:hypothetical protein [Fructobacillus broussonetiae]MBS9338606.1 hypothetical protein [Fructobacillus broussonetiae]